MQQKIVYAGRVATSFARASALLTNLADLSVSAKPVERLTRLIGGERVAQRDEEVRVWEALPLAEKFEAPEGVAPPPLACVFVDGGRLQIRERVPLTQPAQDQAEQPLWEPEPPPEKGFWREDKLGLLAQFNSECCQVDPCPEVPQGFLDVLRIPILARELGKVAAGVPGEGDEAESVLEAEPVFQQEEPEYESPEVGQRRVVGSCQPGPTFARVVAQAAWALGFQQATRKAFVADGSANNWRLRERFFGSFVPIVDFIQALS